MLAGALFNRATGIFTQLVEIQRLGVQIQPDNPLMRDVRRTPARKRWSSASSSSTGAATKASTRCGASPSRRSCCPLESFYESRYIKIAETMRDIDSIADTLITTFADLTAFPGIEKSVEEFAEAAKVKTETLRTDPDLFEVWTTFVASGRAPCGFRAAARRRRATTGTAGTGRCPAAHPRGQGPHHQHHARPGAHAQEHA